jgi:osmotically-inducible protein OsmY
MTIKLRKKILLPLVLMAPMLLNAAGCWIGSIDGEVVGGSPCILEIIDNPEVKPLQQDSVTQTIAPEVQEKVAEVVKVVDDKEKVLETTTVNFDKKITTFFDKKITTFFDKKTVTVFDKEIATVTFDKKIIKKTLKKNATLLEKIKFSLQNDEKLIGSNINVTIFKNTVLLTGIVFSHQLLNYVETKLSAEFPTLKIINHLNTGKNKSVFDHSRDSAINAIILISFQEQTVFDPKDIKVITTNTVVYLMGSVTKNQAKFIKNIVKNSAGVGEVVDLFEYPK